MSLIRTTDLIPSLNLSTQESNLLADLKQLIKDDKKLAKFSLFFHDAFLLSFIRGRKNRLEEAFETVQCYIQLRKDYRSFFKSINKTKLLELVEIIDTGIVKLLRNRDDKGRVVYVIFVDKWNPSEFSIEDLILFFTIVADEFLLNEDGIGKGIVQITDLNGMSLSHCFSLTPRIVKMIIKTFVKSYPVKFKGYHLINENTFVKNTVNFAKLFLSKKLQKRFHLHSNDVTGIHSHISPSILPKSLRGFLEDEDAYEDLEEGKRLFLSKTKFYETFNSLL